MDSDTKARLHYLKERQARHLQLEHVEAALKHAGLSWSRLADSVLASFVEAIRNAASDRWVAQAVYSEIEEALPRICEYLADVGLVCHLYVQDIVSAPGVSVGSEALSAALQANPFFFDPDGFVLSNPTGSSVLIVDFDESTGDQEIEIRELRPQEDGEC